HSGADRAGGPPFKVLRESGQPQIVRIPANRRFLQGRHSSPGADQVPMGYQSGRPAGCTILRLGYSSVTQASFLDHVWLCPQAAHDPTVLFSMVVLSNASLDISMPVAIGLSVVGQLLITEPMTSPLSIVSEQPNHATIVP